MRIRPEFLRSLNRTVDLARLEESRHTIFALTPELRLAYFNPAWLEFAAMNGAPRLSADWPLGRSVMAAVPAALRRFYLDGYASVLAGGRPWETAYAAPTPWRDRSYRMRVDLVGPRAGLVCNHILAHDLPWTDEPRPADERRYRHGDGRLHQCVSCRRFTAPGAASWDRVPAWLAHAPARLSPLLCPGCHVCYFPSQARAA